MLHHSNSSHVDIEEYCSVLQNNYFDFWKFLIEKYKIANKKVRAAEHERNIFMQEYYSNSFFLSVITIDC